MKLTMTILLLATLTLSSLAGTTIEYSYDRQHRLTQASYSDSEKVCYSYDAANNLDLEVSITDAKYLKSFLLWFGKAGDTLGDFIRGLAWWQGSEPRIDTEGHG